VRLQFRRSPPFGRFDLCFVSSFGLQHPVMADDGVDDALPVSRCLRDLRRQDADTVMVCPGITREDVSILHAIARSRTTSIDEVDVIGPRLYSRRGTVLFFFLLEYRRCQRRPSVRSLLCRSIDLIFPSRR